jgi:hypothetical protein
MKIKEKYMQIKLIVSNVSIGKLWILIQHLTFEYLIESGYKSSVKMYNKRRISGERLHDRQYPSKVMKRWEWKNK